MTQPAWKTEKEEHVTEQATEDGRWHFSSKSVTGAEPQCYLSNYDLLGGPGACGASLEDCLRKFIDNCDTFARKLAEAKAEAEEKLAALLANNQQ